MEPSHRRQFEQWVRLEWFFTPGQLKYEVPPKLKLYVLEPVRSQLPCRAEMMEKSHSCPERYGDHELIASNRGQILDAQTILCKPAVLMKANDTLTLFTQGHRHVTMMTDVDIDQSPLVRKKWFSR